MLHNYLLTALRNLRRNRLFTAIHLSGLSIGLLGCILILLFVQEEFRYANYHTKGDRVYRVVRGPEKSEGRYYVNTYSGISPAMQQDFPEVEATARLLDDWWFQVQYENKNFEIDIGLGDPALLDMFDIKLLKGDPKTVLNKPNTIILTERQAQSFFGNEDPIGKVLTIKDDSFPGEFVVTGIMQNMSRYATIAFDGLTSFPSTDSPQAFKNIFNSWGKTIRGRPYRNYIMLKEGFSAAQVESKFPEFETRYLDKEYAVKIQYRLQPINRIRHYSEVDFGITDGHPWGVGESNPRQPRGIYRIHRLSLVGFIILIIACFNFMNLAIAQSNRRAREVGMRKVLGAKRTQLIRQFLTESVLLSFMALVIALGLTDLTLPLFNSFMQVNLTFTYETGLSLTLVGLALVVGLISGSYPAFFLSHLEPVITLKGHLNALTGGARFRKVLVILQFAISSTLVFAAVVMYFQSSFMSKKDIGFDPSLLVNMPI